MRAKQKILLLATILIVCGMHTVHAQTINGRLVSGATHTCGLFEGDVFCWGGNEYGQLGYGHTNSLNRVQPAPVDLGRSREATQISAGDFHTCALLDNGRVKCWGRGDYGRLGYGRTSSLDAPPRRTIRFGLLRRRAIQIASGGSHSCAILVNNTVSCWGLGNVGQLGYGDTQSQSRPPNNGINVFGDAQLTVQITAGGSHTCALSDSGGVKCWGGNFQGQLGYGDTVNRFVPDADIVNIGRGKFARQIVAGSEYTCARVDLNSVNCWGTNAAGQLGYNQDDIPRLLAPIPNSSYQEDIPLVNIAAGSQHVCVLDIDLNMKCWGQGNSGQLGYGSREDTFVIPVTAVETEGRILQIALGGEHTCALVSSDLVQCWGSGNRGQLGYGGSNTLLIPNYVVSLSTTNVILVHPVVF